MESHTDQLMFLFYEVFGRTVKAARQRAGRVFHKMASTVNMTRDAPGVFQADPPAAYTHTPCWRKV